MPSNVQQIFDGALSLPPAERASLIESLWSSLDRPDPTAEALWAEEAERRIAAFEDGRIGAVTADDVFAEYESP